MVTQWVAELGFELQHLETSGHRRSMCKGPGVERAQRELPGKKGTEKGLKEMEEVGRWGSLPCNQPSIPSHWVTGPLHQEVTGAPLPPQGDSGGPVVCRRGQVAGILSFSSENCTNIFKPPVAVAVAPYMSWIKNTLRHNSSPPSP